MCSIFEIMDKNLNYDFLLSYVNSIINFCSINKYFNQTQDNSFITYDFFEGELLLSVVTYHGLILIGKYTELSQQNYVRLFLINLLSHFYNFFGSIFICNLLEEEIQRAEESIHKYEIKIIKINETENKIENLTGHSKYHNNIQATSNALNKNIDVSLFNQEKQDHSNNSSLKRLQILNRIDIVDLASDFFMALNYNFEEKMVNFHPENLNLLYTTLKNSNSQEELFSHNFLRKKSSYLDFSKVQTIQNLIDFEGKLLLSSDNTRSIRINKINEQAFKKSIYIIVGKFLFYLIGPISLETNNNCIFATFIFKVTKTYIKRLKECGIHFILTNGKYIKIKREDESKIETEISEMKALTKNILDFFTEIEGTNDHIISEFKRRDQEFVNDPNSTQTNQTSILKMNTMKEEKYRDFNSIKGTEGIENSVNFSIIEGKEGHHSIKVIESNNLSKLEDDQFQNSKRDIKSINQSIKS